MKNTNITWEEYLEHEKAHVEDPVGTQQFFRDILKQYGGLITNRRFESVLEIGIGRSGGYIGVLNNYVDSLSIDPLTGDIRKKIEDTELIEDSFDLVVISNALSHCDKPAVAASKIEMSLEKGGLVFLFNYYNERLFHPHVYTKKEQILKLFKQMKWLQINEVGAHRGRNPWVLMIGEKI